MLTFTTFFLALGVIAGAFGHSYERTYGVNHVAVALCLTGVVVFTLLLMQATIAGFEALTAAMFWAAGYGFGWATCTGIGNAGHKRH